MRERERGEDERERERERGGERNKKNKKNSVKFINKTGNPKTERFTGMFLCAEWETTIHVL